jgi:catechol 2,3-dioxygenase
MGLLWLDHVVIRVRDRDAALAWYRDAIGLMEMARQGEAVFLGCGGDEHFDLGLVPGGAGLDHFAFTVRDVAELEQVERRLSAGGVRTETRSGEPGVAAAIQFQLPSGHAMEVVVRQKEPGYIHPAQWQRPVLDTPTDVNHVTIQARDVQGLATFLHDVLGFRISDVYEPAPGVWGFAFLRVAENHHDVAIASGDADAILHHVAFLTGGIGNLSRFADRLARHDWPIEAGIGRHGPGGNLFLYVKDPTGNRVELGADMARVPDTDLPPRIWRGNFGQIFNVWTQALPPESFAQGT